MLKDLQFSDIILFSADGSAKLKGLPGAGQHLVPIPDEYRKESGVLLEHVQKQFKDKDSSASLRIHLLDCIFRAAVYNDVESENVFFLRRLADSVPEFHMIGFPSPLLEWMTSPDQCNMGLLLFSGGQNSGKSTTQASFVKSRLTSYGGHAVTFENPVEMPLAGKHGDDGWCFQTEIGSEAKLAQHIERAHRYSAPNIIVIGEIRTKYAASESLRVALGSNRQLVVATIHGFSIITALERFLAWALEQDGEVTLKNLAQTLVGVVHLELSENEKDKPRSLKVPEFLFLPFNDEARQIRAKIASNNLNKLADEINNQSNQVALTGRFV